MLSRTAFGLIISIGFFSSSVVAEVLPGWTHTPPTNPDTTRNGVLLDGIDVIYGSPTVAEIDGNPDNGLETAVATSDGILNVIAADGSLLWSKELPNHKCTATNDDNKSYSSPAVGKLFNNNKNFIVIGYGGVGGKDCGGGVVAYNALNGKRKWHLDLVKFSKKEGFPVPIAYSVFSTPVIGDMNNDGYLEIAFGSFDRNVYIINSWGKVVWYYIAADTVWSSGVFLNVAGGRHKELIIGTDISANPSVDTKNGGYVYAFKTKIKKIRKKKKKKQIKQAKRVRAQQLFFADDRAYYWRTYFNQTIYSSPAVADLLPNPGLEIAVGSGCFFPEISQDKHGKWVKILSAKTGEVLQTLDAPTCVISNPAIGDINGDGQLNVVATVPGHKSIGGDGASKVIAWDPNNSSPMWTTIPRDKSINDSWAGYLSSPAIADIDSNGSLEVIAANGNAVIIFEGSTGEQLSCSANPCESERYGTSGIIRGTPAIADIDSNGSLEIIIGSKRNYNGGAGILHAWTGFESEVFSNPGSLTPQALPWPQHRRGAKNNAVLN